MSAPPPPPLALALALGPAADDFLDRMPAGKLRRQIARKVLGLAANPYPQGCKKLRGVSSGPDAVWRVRSGAYRILYVVRATELLVIDIDNRKDVYR